LGLLHLLLQLREVRLDAVLMSRSTAVRARAEALPTRTRVEQSVCLRPEA
jgi:hypothetical protein